MKKAAGWFKELSAAGKVGAIVAVLLGITVTAGALGGAGSQSTVEALEPAAPISVRSDTEPIIEHKTETSIEPVAFGRQTKDDASLPSGTTAITQAGIDGERTITYDVTYTDGNETNRVQTGETITKQPLTEITSRGTYVAPPKPAPGNCDSNYSGCVPVASDVDCASGSGNGPAYVAGPVRVIGYDIYDLDRDGNGWGCE